MSNSQTPLIEELIQRVLKLCPVRRFKTSTRESVDLMPLAKYMGRIDDRQLRQWLIQRTVTPQGEHALKMQEWCDLQEHGMKFPSKEDFPTSGK